jgi:Zn ribbon nucleic-acid-binding protein
MEYKMAKCPKCNSIDVVQKHGDGVGWGPAIYVGFGLGMQGTKDWESYLCTNCGYFENYLTNKDWLTKIKANPQSVGWTKSG